MWERKLVREETGVRNDGGWGDGIRDRGLPGQLQPRGGAGELWPLLEADPAYLVWGRDHTKPTPNLCVPQIDLQKKPFASP